MKFEITSNAINKIKSLLAGNAVENKFFRVAVDSGGCNGFQYKYEVANHSNPDDIIVKQDEINILIDEISKDFLENCKLDYIEELVGEYFEISNPKSKSKCGCGNSFAV